MPRSAVASSLRDLGVRLRTPMEVRTDAIRRRVLDVGSLFVLCALVGVIAGLGAVFFHVILEGANHLILDGLAGFRPDGPAGERGLFADTTTPFSRAILFLLPAIGGLVSGVFVFLLAPEAEGHGTDAAIDAYHHKKGVIRARIPFVKTLASAITLGTGGSAGREGPISQIGAGLGSILASWLGLSAQQRRILLAAGMGAGLGAIFRAPLAGALFASEVLYAGVDLEFEVLVPAILSSIVAYSTFGMVFGWAPLFATHGFTFTNPLELGPYIVLAIIVAIGGRTYAQVFYGVRNGFRQVPLPTWLKPALGGLVVGCIGLFFPDALATSFGVVQKAFDGHESAQFLFTVAVAKVVATAMTVGSGGSGGLFGPAVVVGGSLGGAVGLVFHQWMPHLVRTPGAYAMVGMAGFFAATAHVPISTVIMVSELTGDYQLLVPTMLVCMLGSMIVRRQTLYEKQLPSRAESPAHRREAVRALLRRLVVADVLKARPNPAPPPVTEGTTLGKVFGTFSTTGAPCLAVVDEAGRLVGQINREALQPLLGKNNTLDPTLVARDIMSPPVTATPRENIHDVLRLMSARQIAYLLVVEEHGAPPVAILTNGGVNAIFDEFLEDED